MEFFANKQYDVNQKIMRKQTKELDDMMSDMKDKYTKNLEMLQDGFDKNVYETGEPHAKLGFAALAAETSVYGKQLGEYYDCNATVVEFMDDGKGSLKPQFDTYEPTGEMFKDDPYAAAIENKRIEGVQYEMMTESQKLEWDTKQAEKDETRPKWDKNSSLPTETPSPEDLSEYSMDELLSMQRLHLHKSEGKPEGFVEVDDYAGILDNAPHDNLAAIAKGAAAEGRAVEGIMHGIAGGVSSDAVTKGAISGVTAVDDVTKGAMSGLANADDVTKGAMSGLANANDVTKGAMRGLANADAVEKGVTSGITDTNAVKNGASAGLAGSEALLKGGSELQKNAVLFATTGVSGVAANAVYNSIKNTNEPSISDTQSPSFASHVKTIGSNIAKTFSNGMAKLKESLNPTKSDDFTSEQVAVVDTPSVASPVGSKPAVSSRMTTIQPDAPKKASMDRTAMAEALTSNVEHTGSESSFDLGQ